MSDEDIIKMIIDNNLTDKNGNSIPVTVPQPEYVTETFSLKPNMYTNNIFTTEEDDE